MESRLEADIPNQPTPEQLKADPWLCRFTLVFDREGYSPGFLRQTWDKRIACQTYRKQPYQLWPPEEFAETPVRLKNGITVTWKLAERGVLLGAKESEQIWVREVRKLTERGPQTSVVGIQYRVAQPQIARDQFGRWSQENQSLLTSSPAATKRSWSIAVTPSADPAPVASRQTICRITWPCTNVSRSLRPKCG